MTNIASSEQSTALFLGLDIGTTTLSAVVCSAASGTPVETRTVPHNAMLPSESAWDRREDAERILRIARETVDALIDRCPDILSIGISGQMHGIVYVDADGTAVSRLYTWQDGRAELRTGGETACERILRLTGRVVPSGYGLATHTALMLSGEVPKTAVRITTIMDYVASRLCGAPAERIHATNAASFGLFDTAKGQFDPAALRRVGIEPSFLPAVAGGYETVGTYRGRPVSLAIGDNQGSFLGSMRDEKDAVLVNIGTGSQISVQTDTVFSGLPADLEQRPYLSGKTLLCGSALCGGRAYALLERFTDALLVASGAGTGERCTLLNRLAERGMAHPGLCPRVRPTFSGTRSNPDDAGSIIGIRTENFTPEALAAGWLCGMAEELYSLYEKMPTDRSAIRFVVASGNAVRNNPALRRAIASVFRLPVAVPQMSEECACGAAIYGAVAAGIAKQSELTKRIQYLTEA